MIRVLSDVPGIPKPAITTLPQIQARLTFIYLEHCMISREEGAITVTNDQGVVYLPAASISVILLGPGTNLTHRAMELIGDCGVSVVWVGEHGVRYYASGRPATHQSGLLLKQAELVCNMRSHLEVARSMYAMRFPDEDVSVLTLQQLRGKEGARVRQTYRKWASEYGVKWSGREYDPNDFSSGNPVNQALSAGNVCLYGLSAAVIAGIGCANGLGFVHVGHELSFAYDMADLYKAEITIPLAFKLAGEGVTDIGREMRLQTRDAMVQHHIPERMVQDIHILFQDVKQDVEENPESNAVYLWDRQKGTVANGISYGLEGEKFRSWSDIDDCDYNDDLPD